MKKFLAYLLVAVFCISSLAACGGNNSDNGSTATKSKIDSAKEYLYAMYKDKQGNTASDFERVAVL
ncbi:MAG: hypothetical protein K6B75_05225, partial [Lachnospiraceae bacterium]|nr:hypothetical protein [Lachnospiraceae bacterium]